MSGNASDQTEGISADKGSRIMSAAHSVTWPPISQRRVMETMIGPPVIPIADHNLDSAIQVPAGNAADDHAHTDNNGTSNAHSDTWPPISQRRVMETMLGVPGFPIFPNASADHNTANHTPVPAAAENGGNITKHWCTRICACCNWTKCVFVAFGIIFIFIYVTNNLQINLFGRGKDGSVEIIMTNSSGTYNIPIRAGPRKTPDINEGQHHVPAPSKSAEMQPFSNMPPSAPEGGSPEGTIPSQVVGQHQQSPSEE